MRIYWPVVIVTFTISLLGGALVGTWLALLTA